MTSEALSQIGLLLVGVSLLWKGADWVVQSACRIAHRFELSDAVIGATVVAIGTSAPEITVTLVAALRGQPDISIGNVVGSNIFNLGIILGGCAAIWSPVPIARSLVRRDVPVLLLATLLLLVLLHDNALDAWEGLAMVVFLGMYVLYLVSRGGLALEDGEQMPEGKATRRDYLVLALGLAAVISGAHLLVRAASELALMLGISPYGIAVTVVAMGTSLPELATALMAAHRGRMAMMAGTLVGSDIFNVLGVLGLAAILHRLDVSHGVEWSLMTMVAMVTVLRIVMRRGWCLTRTEGMILVLVALLRWKFDLSLPG
ncbi:MAG: calcium/sodium antiporter [Myxococcota bacterium]